MRSLRRPAAAKASRASRSSASTASTRARHGRGVAAAVPRVAADARDLDGRQARERLRERERARGGRLARAVQADVHLDEQLGRRAAALAAPRRAPRRPRAPSTATVSSRPSAARSREAIPLVGAERRVVHEDARRAGLLEDLRLARLRDGQAAGAERELPEADLGRLVRLRVRPERDPVRVGVRLQIAAGWPRAGRGRRPRRASRPRSAGAPPAPRAAPACDRLRCASHVSIVKRRARRSKLPRMGLENPMHLLVLAVIILLVFGSSQLPKIARSAGKHAREAKEGITSFKQEFEHGVGDEQPAHGGRRHAPLGQSEDDRPRRRQQGREPVQGPNVPPPRRRSGRAAPCAVHGGWGGLRGG